MPLYIGGATPERKTDHVYQMSTKKGAEPLCPKGSSFFHFLDVYQMSTKATF